MRIRTQLLLPVVLLLLGVAAITVATALSAARLATRQIETRLRSVARFIDEDSRFPLHQNVLRLLGPLSGAEYLLDGRTPLASFDDAPDHLPADVPVADEWHDLSLGTPVRAGGVTYLCSGLRLSRREYAGDVLYIFYPESLLRDARWEAMWPALLFGSALGLAALGLALWQARGLSRRVGELERRTRAIASGDFSPMPLPSGADEVRSLAASVNDMAGQLARLQDAVRRTERLRLLGQIAGGLAHQLRNGLTGARLAVQLQHADLAGQDTSALDVALRELTLLETHVKRLLDLGKVSPTDRRECDLTAIVSEAVALLQPRCRHAGIDLRWHPPAPLVASLDEGQWGQLLVNLLTNAIDAAGPGGIVEVGLRREAGIVLEVADSGPGPDDATAGRLFEPFVTTKPEGVGLGLAVSRQIAEAHGGRIGWRREPGRTVFRVEVAA